MIVLLSILGAAATGALAVRFGADSRPGFDERPEAHQHRPSL